MGRKPLGVARFAIAQGGGVSWGSNSAGPRYRQHGRSAVGSEVWISASPGRPYMRYASAALLALTLLGAPSLAPAAGPADYAVTVSCSETNTAVSFGFSARNILVINDDTTNETYFTTSSTTATTSDPSLKAAEDWSYEGIPTSGMGIICAAGETASVRVSAWE